MALGRWGVVAIDFFGCRVPRVAVVLVTTVTRSTCGSGSGNRLGAVGRVLLARVAVVRTLST